MKRTAVPQSKTIENPTSDRRYPVGKYRAYDRTFESLLKRSTILNPDARRHDSFIAISMNDIHDLKTHLVQLEGEPGKNDMYLFRGEWRKALIPAAEKKLRELWHRFRRYANDRVKQGYEIEAPTAMPTAMLNERLAVEAILDIFYLERHMVKEKIKEKEKADVEKMRVQDREAVLRFGPQAKGYHPEDENPKIDGQKVSFTEEDGIPFIADKRSPYNGMSLASYRVMSKQWLETLKVQAEEREEEMKKTANGYAVPSQPTRPRQIFRNKKPSPDELPAPPKDALKIEVNAK